MFGTGVEGPEDLGFPGVEDQDPEDDEDYDVPQDASSDGEAPSLYEGYTSDHASDPPAVEGRRPTVVLGDDRCLIPYTPLNSNVTRICGRYCTGPGGCQRRMPLVTRNNCRNEG
jgi:hypothetical protein